MDAPNFSSSLSFFHQRCASPLVLCNNVPPKFSNQQQVHPPVTDQFAGRQTHDARRFFVEQANRHSNNDDLDFGQLPKRTVSLGPKRAFPPAPRRHQIGEGLRSKSPFLQGGADRDQTFNRAARELQSSLTELDKLIDAPVPVAPSHESSSSKPPRYTSFLTNTEDSLLRPSFARQCGKFPALELKLNGCEPSNDGQVMADNNDSSTDWKPSSSVTDLRSVFEQSSSKNLNLQAPSSSRPPRSASPSFLKNSPFLQNNGAFLGQDQLSAGGDYTIRRTTSTNSRSTTIDRNPYRNYYR